MQFPQEHSGKRNCYCLCRSQLRCHYFKPLKDFIVKMKYHRPHMWFGLKKSTISKFTITIFLGISLYNGTEGLSQRISCVHLTPLWDRQDCPWEYSA